MLTRKLQFPTAFPDRFFFLAFLDTDLIIISVFNPSVD